MWEFCWQSLRYVPPPSPQQAAVILSWADTALHTALQCSNQTAGLVSLPSVVKLVLTIEPSCQKKKMYGSAACQGALQQAIFLCDQFVAALTTLPWPQQSSGCSCEGQANGTAVQRGGDAAAAAVDGKNDKV